MNTGRAKNKPGTISHALSFVAHFIQYFKARAVLAGLEAKEAGINYGLGAAFIVGALLVAILGYIFMLMTAVFGIGAAFEEEHAWIVVMGIVAVLHLGGAVALVMLARKRFGASLFPETIAEFEKDQQWLNRETPNH